MVRNDRYLAEGLANVPLFKKESILITDDQPIEMR